MKQTDPNLLTGYVDAPDENARPNIFESKAVAQSSLAERRIEPCTYMALRGRPKSDTAEQAIKCLALALCRQASSTSRPTGKYKTALAAAVFDLLKAGSFDPVRACYRPMAAHDFTGNPVGYRPFRRVIDHLSGAGYIAVTKGQADPRAVTTKQGVVTRIRPTIKLFDVLASQGISSANRWSHFVEDGRAPVGELIRLKATRPELGNGRKGIARSMSVDRAHAKVAAYSEQVERLNDFLAKQAIEGVEHHGLFRGFNLGDDASFEWNKGGRLYSLGGGYQNAPKEERLAMRINGERVVEIDIGASHLTILHSLLGVPLPNKDDLYEGLGFPRVVAKAWISITLGYGRIPKRWSARARESYNEDFPRQNIQRDYPIAKTGDLVIRQFPILESYVRSNLTWADLQFIESEIVIRAMIHLMDRYNLPSLPVHDSIIVPKSAMRLGHQALRDSFYRSTSLHPILKIKRGRGQ